MFFRILKNDLRHQPVTNIILFITLAVTFAAAGVNNIVTVQNAQDDYMRMSGVTDYYVLSAVGFDADALEDTVAKFESVSSYTAEPMLALTKTNFRTKNGADSDANNAIMLCAAERSATTYFALDDRKLTAPANGGMWVPQKLIDAGLLEQGETVTVTLGDTSLDLTVTEIVKDGLFGADGMGIYRVLVSDEDFSVLDSDSMAVPMRSVLLGFATEDQQALLSEISEKKLPVLAQFAGETLRMLNYLNVAIAALLTVFSACLIVLFLVILRYTIRFTLNQEFRDIGVMKAVGLTDRKIGDLYLVKYFAMAVLGAVLGFAVSIPFGDLLLKTLSSSMVIANRDPFGINLVCTAVILLLVLLFCRRCVRMLQRFSPADAVRGGNTGESYGLNHRLTLWKSNMRPGAFLPLNDILTGVKQYLVMGLAFTVCLLLALVLADTVNTMESSGVLAMFGMKQSDAVLLPDITTEDSDLRHLDRIYAENIKEIEQVLRKEGISARVFCDFAYAGRLRKDKRDADVNVWVGHGVKADEYSYLSGSAPLGEDEIAITPRVAEQLGVEIGDTVTLCFAEERDYLVTGYYQTMMNMGVGARVSDSAFISDQNCSSTMGFQILFDDAPSSRELEGRLDRLRELFPDGKVYDSVSFLETMIGDISGTLRTVRMILTPLLLAVCALVTVLMELSFIEKEKREIAMLKAIGFRSAFIIRWHMCRAGITALVSVLIAELLSGPVAQVTAGIPFRIMGAAEVEFVVEPFENYVLWPGVILAVILAAVFFTALRTGRITARDTAGIE